jgi:hypothetical protein
MPEANDSSGWPGQSTLCHHLLTNTEHAAAKIRPKIIKGTKAFLDGKMTAHTVDNMKTQYQTHSRRSGAGGAAWKKCRARAVPRRAWGHTLPSFANKHASCYRQKPIKNPLGAQPFLGCKMTTHTVHQNENRDHTHSGSWGAVGEASVRAHSVTIC